MNRPVIFSGTSNPKLAQHIAWATGNELGSIYHHSFPSGESYCQIKENIRGADVFLIQSIVKPANDNLMQLLIMADACRRASAGRLTAVIPYFGYSRQDRKDKSRVPISAKLVLDILAAAGFNRIVTMDLHAPQIAGFTNLPFDHLYFRPALIKYLRNLDVQAVVSPDIGAVKRSEEYARKMNVELAFISKRRISDTEVQAQQFVGDVNGKNVLIVDDLTESAGTLVQAAQICKDNGAKKVYCAVTHNCLTPVGVERVATAKKNGVIDDFISSNTTGWTAPPNMSGDHIFTVDVSELFASAIRGIWNNESISVLFD